MKRILVRVRSYLRDLVHKLRCKRAIRIASRDYLRHVCLDGTMPVGFEGICWYLYQALRYVFQDDKNPAETVMEYIQHKIPKYTYANASIYCGASGDPESYWWRKDDWQSRVCFLIWLEENL